MFVTVDLHGMTVAEAMAEFHRAYHRAVDDGNRELRIVHGSNRGKAIKSSLIRLLDNNRACLTYAPQPGNEGCTIVWPSRRLPSGSESTLLSSRILACCANPIMRNKLISHLIRRHPEPEIIAALGQLVSSRVIDEIQENGKKKYVAHHGDAATRSAKRSSPRSQGLG